MTVLLSLSIAFNISARNPQVYSGITTASPAASFCRTSIILHRSLNRVSQGLFKPGHAASASIACSYHASTMGKEQIAEAPQKDKPIAPAKPSASILLFNQKNEVLLLHRVQTSSAFPAAHVFPGGNLEASDGALPETGRARHEDCLAYRAGAIRELFEESGILLAKQPGKDGLLDVSSEERSKGRKAVHSNETTFAAWLKGQNHEAELDTKGLIPFSHWITPPNVPKRFSTQMYVYFSPLPSPSTKTTTTATESIIERQAALLEPTNDGGLENTAAAFLPCHAWLAQARAGAIILFPPQFLLLHLASQHLDIDPASPPPKEISRRRASLATFITTAPSNSRYPPYLHKYISPLALGFLGGPHGSPDACAVLGLEKPGRELVGSGLQGDDERVVLVKFREEGPREVEVRGRAEVLAEMRAEREREEAGGAGDEVGDGGYGAQGWVKRGNRRLGEEVHGDDGREKEKEKSKL